jgi:hypothetical protein
MPMASAWQETNTQPCAMTYGRQQMRSTLRLAAIVLAVPLLLSALLTVTLFLAFDALRARTTE